jgi:hypothetical protein
MPELPEWPLNLTVGPSAYHRLPAVWNLVRDRRDEKQVEKSLDWPQTRGTVTTREVAWAHVEVGYSRTRALLPHGVLSFALQPRFGPASVFAK